MPKQFWTQEKTNRLRYLYKHHPEMTRAQIAAELGTTAQAVSTYASKIGIKKGQPNEIRLTDERERWLTANFPHCSNEICALLCGISPRSVVRFAREHGLTKTAQFMKECQAHTAKKARESHLKNGTYNPKGFIIPGSEKFRFKPGHAPHPKKAKADTEAKAV